MSEFYYDLHLHSCLSPCADNDNTPNNLAGMGTLAGLQLMALTDHNTCRNCPAFFAAAARQGIVPVAGMELTTAEDIHLVCLFPTLDDAMAFDAVIDRRRVRIPNRPAVFGDQLLCDAADAVIGTEPDLLPNATTVSLEEAIPLAEQHRGIAYPAHIDREANGILAVLGDLPPTPRFSCVELHDGDREAAIRSRVDLGNALVLVSSDAHFLWDIRDKDRRLSLDADAAKPDAVRRALIDRLRGGL